MTPKQLTLLVGFLMLLSFFAGNLFNRTVLAKPDSNLQTSQPVNSGAAKWEYKVIWSQNEYDATLEATLNKWGEQGFDLADIQVYSYSNNKYVVMKRQKK